MWLEVHQPDLRVLREALSRLNTEGLLRFSPGKVYYCRDLDVHEIFYLYELRKAVEVAAVKLAIKRAKDEDIDALLAFLEKHIDRRLDQITSAFKEGYAQIYMPNLPGSDSLTR